MNNGLQPSWLKCEYEIEPIGLDVRHPRFSWIVEKKRNIFQKAYQVLVSDDLEMLNDDRTNYWDSGKVESTSNIGVKYFGRKLESDKTYFWKVRIWDSRNKVSKFSKNSKFETGLLEDNDWHGEWLTTPQFFNTRSPIFRKEFKIVKDIKRARAHISGLGYYELMVNGKKVGKNLLDPAWSVYNKRIYYTIYDIEPYLKEGNNVIGILLGNGWFISPLGWDSSPDNKVWFGHPSYPGRVPQFILQINIVLKDGKRDEIVSRFSDDWKVGLGPITLNAIHTGERYDARLEKDDWTIVGYDTENDKEWFLPVIAESPGGKMVSQKCEPIKVLKDIKPISISEPEKGIFVVDMGQEFSGWTKIKVSGRRGNNITLRYAELLYSNGKVNQENLRTAKATDIYILKGEGSEEYEPRFTYHGFRYVQVEGWPGKLNIEDITGRVVATSVEKIGDFNCSNELINKIHEISMWTYISNRHSVPTDNCTRDERQGWLNDTPTRSEAEIINFDMSRFFPKWIKDIIDEQGERGSLPNTAPYVYGAKSSEPIFSISLVLIPWYLYVYYGDRVILENIYLPMKNLLSWLESQSKDNIIEYGLVGDWVPPIIHSIEGSVEGAISSTPVSMVSTGYFYYHAILASKISKVLGEKEDYKYYTELAVRIKTAINKHFFDHKSNNYATGNQASNSLALHLGIVPEDKKKKVLQNLIDDIKANDYHLTTGHPCVRHLLEALSDSGNDDIAYRIINQKTYPGWGYMVEKGATTIWERWEYSTGEEMNSHNQTVFGFISMWFYKYIAGIEIIDINDRNNTFNIMPKVFRQLDYANASIKTVMGTISSSWKKDKKIFVLDAEIPFNCKAKVYIPKIDIDNSSYIIKEGEEVLWKNGRSVNNIEGIYNQIEEEMYFVFSVGSGKYSFKLSVLD